jgi:uncharacterized phage protein gp47/JayE
MAAWFSSLTDKVTDFSIGSTIRALFEAIAMEIEELYVFVEEELQKAIRDSAYSLFGFTRNEAVPARVDHIGFTIPKGFQVSTLDGLVYATTVDTFVPMNTTTVRVPAVCLTRGFIGNVPANTITKLVSSLPEIISVTNPNAATGGVDEESETKRRERFNKYIISLAKGTKNAILYQLSSIPELSYISIKDEFPGVASVYVSTPSGTISEELFEKIKNALEEVRAAGIMINVLGVAKRTVDLTINVEVVKSADRELIKNQVRNIVENYLNSREVGEDFFPNHLVGIIIAYDPTIIRNVTISPNQKIVVAKNQILRPGNITVQVSVVADE